MYSICDHIVRAGRLIASALGDPGLARLLRDGLPREGGRDAAALSGNLEKAETVAAMILREGARATLNAFGRTPGSRNGPEPQSRELSCVRPTRS